MHWQYPQINQVKFLHTTMLNVIMKKHSKKVICKNVLIIGEVMHLFHTHLNSGKATIQELT